MFQLIPLIASEELIFYVFFRKFNISIPMETNQIERFGLKWYAWWRTTQQTFLQSFCQNICSEIAINLNFHFSHCKSMAT